VSEDEIAAAMRRLWRHDNQKVEGAAGVAVAAYLNVANEIDFDNIALILCGANIDDTRYYSIIE